MGILDKNPEEIIYDKIETNNEYGFLEKIAEITEGDPHLKEETCIKYFDELHDKYNHYKSQIKDDKKAKYLAFKDIISECKKIQENRIEKERKNI